jgi:hypothetical protein
MADGLKSPALELTRNGRAIRLPIQPWALQANRQPVFIIVVNVTFVDIANLEMKQMDRLRRNSSIIYIFLTLAAGMFITACERVSVDVETPTPLGPTATPIVISGSISGRIWNDECLNYGETMPAGCVHSASEVDFVGNGILDEGESGIGSTQVLLGVGQCPAEGLTEAVTGEDGSFIFEGLIPGEYCVSVKDSKQLPGFWTYPQGEEVSNAVWTTITVEAGETVSNVNFGRDHLDTPPPPPTETPAPVCTNQAMFVSDVTTPDGTRFNPGDTFTKIWRFRNSGSCIWTKDYAIVHIDGDSLLGPNMMTLPSEVEPGEDIDISLALQAPKTDGVYDSYWKFRDDAGELFGIGNDQNLAFLVSIEVGPEPGPEFPDWRGEYFANKHLDGEPAFIKNDRTLDKTWGLRSPNEDYLPRDNFSVRWTRTLEFDAKTYRFLLDITDGGKLYIDDVPVLNGWIDGGRRTVSIDVVMKEGEHEVKFEYYNTSGGAVAQLWYEVVSEHAFDGWKASYWMNKTMDSDLVLIKDEEEINFDWGDDGPVSGGPADNFSAQWERKIEFEPGLYAFQATADDGIRVYVDSALVIDEWHDSSGSEVYDAELRLNSIHEITVLYYENAGEAKVSFEWILLDPENLPPETVDVHYPSIRMGQLE